MSEKVQHGVQQVKRCCSTCDTKQLCHICGEQTQYACSDCRIDFGVTIWVCPTKKCRDAHEQKCPYTLRHRIEELLKALRAYRERCPVAGILCAGYPTCDGDLEGMPHEPGCPRFPDVSEADDRCDLCKRADLLLKENPHAQ